jgi:hypothetical protein
MTLNPLAAEYDPVMTALQQLSEEIAESVLLDPVYPTDLEQVAQIAYKDSLFELYWNGTNAILDNRQKSWKFANLTIRKIIYAVFGTVQIANENTALDEPASYAPAIIVDIM